MRISETSRGLAKFAGLARRITEQKPTKAINKASLNLLPEVSEGLLVAAYDFAQRQSLINPKLAWAIGYVVASAAKHQKVGIRLQARSAWNLGWAANECLEPHLAEQALLEAKRLFEQIGDRGWVAACDWQLHAVPYTKSNFVTTKQALEDALVRLRRSNLEAFIAPCIHSLAFANLLINTRDTLNRADELIAEAEQIYTLSGNAIGSARTRRQRAALLTRKSNFSAAIDTLLELRDEFARLGSRIDLAKVHFQLALNYSTMGSPIDEARSLYEQAIDTYRSATMPLPEAECLYGLGILLIRLGAFAEAEQTLLESRKTFELYGIPGLLADNLNDSGRLARIVGNYGLALQRFQRCLEINQNLGSRLQAAVAKTNLGHIYSKLGRFQSSLVQLEEASRELEKMENPGRLADCWLYLADTWAQLGRYPYAFALLDAIKEKAPNDLQALAFEASLAKAYCLIGSQRFSEARPYILSEVSRWQDSEARPDLPLLRRVLGLVQYYEKEAIAEQTLEEAQAEFHTMGMAEEDASCQLLLAEIYASSRRDQKAISAWESALSLVEGGFPDIRIGCYIGLGALYEKNGQGTKAASLYRQAAQAIRETTPDFWQPSIFSFHMAKLLLNLELVFRFFLSHDFAEESIEILEKLKAHTFKQRLLEKSHRRKTKQDQIDQLRGTIEVFQKENMSPSGREDWLARISRSQASHARLVPILDSIERQYGILEREGGKPAGGRRANFSISRFRVQANKRLGKFWIALDYYMTDHEIILVGLTADQLFVKSIELTPRLKIALSASSPRNTNDIVSPRDLELLAEQLIPREMLPKKNEKTVLIVSPHKTLWSIPWAGLPQDDGSNMLVDTSHITTVPSLESLMVLWERSTPKEVQKRPQGGFIGLSNFRGRQNDLPFVGRELEYLREQRIIKQNYLLNEWATRKNVLAFLEKNNLPSEQKLDFLHLATHIQYEQRSSLLCNIVLDDGKFWSEELFDSCELPGLVYLSTCNGASSFAFEGGEQIGIPLTLLSNGANTVIGSWTTISDEAALQLTGSFYEQVLRHKRPVAEALARAQQRARDEMVRFSDWAYVSCVGIPDLTIG